MNKSFLLVLLSSIICFMVSSCKEDEIEVSPEVPYTIDINGVEFENGDSLYGKVIINQEEMVVGTEIKKIDCRLGNIVIGTTENQMECPFGVRLKDKPVGTHTFSVIIKCVSPDCDETYWRTDSKFITITK